MSGDKATVEKTGFRWGRLVLVISLALNLLVVGMVAGTVAHRAREHSGGLPPGRSLMNYGPYAQALSPAERRNLYDTMMREAHQMRADRRAMRRDFEKVLSALRVQPFDRDGVEKIMGQQQARVDGQATRVRNLMLDYLADMSDADRANFADHLQALLRRGPPHHAMQDGDR